MTKIQAFKIFTSLTSIQLILTNLIYYSFPDVRRVVFAKTQQRFLSELQVNRINVADIVDIDDQAFQEEVAEELAAQLGESVSHHAFLYHECLKDFFRGCIMFVIVLNSLMIALETNTYLVNIY